MGERTIGAKGVTIPVGGMSRQDLVRALTGVGVRLNVHAETLLAEPDFDAPREQTLTLVEHTVAELGLPDGAVQSSVFAAAHEHGLELCPLLAAPHLRLALLNQDNAPDSVLSAGRAPTGALHVASAPLSQDVEHPKGFYLRVVDGVPWLRGYRCDDTYVWGPEQSLAFVRPAAHPHSSYAAGPGR